MELTAAQAALAAFTVSTAASIHQSAQQKKQNKKSQAAATRAQNERALQNKIRAVREGLIKRANLEATTSVAGLQDTSAYAGGISSLGSQLEGTFESAEIIQDNLNQASNAASKANQFGANAGIFSSLANIGLQSYSSIDG